jgi:hypothetical protein
MDINEVYSEDAKLITLAEESVKWQVILHTVMSFSLPENTTVFKGLRKY